MKRTIFVSMLIIPVVLLFGSSVYGGWKQKVARNQIKATEYITVLQKGADPDKIARPSIRRDQKPRAKAANREVKEAMERAEKLARAGMHRRIENPVFTPIVSDEGYQQLKKSHKKGNR